MGGRCSEGRSESVRACVLGLCNQQKPHHKAESGCGQTATFGRTRHEWSRPFKQARFNDIAEGRYLHSIDGLGTRAGPWKGVIRRGCPGWVHWRHCRFQDLAVKLAVRKTHRLSHVCPFAVSLTRFLLRQRIEALASPLYDQRSRRDQGVHQLEP